MRIRLTFIGIITAMGAAAAPLLPGAAIAAGGFSLLPSLAATEIYDDNLFFTPEQHEEDRFLRLRPAVRFGYRTLPTDFGLNLSADLERYNRHQELNSNKARRAADVDYSFRPSRVMTLQANASYVKTRTPSELAALTGVQFGRVFAERRSFSPAVQYQLSDLSTGTARYEYIRDRISGEVGSKVNSLDLGLDRRFDRQAVGNVRYRYDRFHFDTGQTVNSHTLLAGGSMQVTPRLSLSALAGPRFTEDEVQASARASLLYSLPRGRLDLDYAREQTTILGVVGTVTSESLAATFAYLTTPEVELRAKPRYTVSTGGGLRTEVYQFMVEAGWQVARYFTVVASYEFTTQHGSLNSSSTREITHNVAMLGFVIAPPQRVERETRPRIYLPSTLGGEPAPMPGELRQAPTFEEDEP